jgi:hypothetical protein
VSWSKPELILLPWIARNQPLRSIPFYSSFIFQLQLFCDMAKSQTVRSQSIPIQRNLQDIVADAEEKRDVAMADFRDYQFCRAVLISNMRSKLSSITSSAQGTLSHRPKTRKYTCRHPFHELVFAVYGITQPRIIYPLPWEW